MAIMVVLVVNIRVNRYVAFIVVSGSVKHTYAITIYGCALSDIGHTRVYGYHNNVPCVWRTAEEHYHYARKALKDSKVSE